jgi:PAS domain S-box-containing protein
VTVLDSRAIENIASAPATVGDRRWAGGVSAAVLAMFGLSLPFARTALGQIPSFLPTVVGAAIVALVLVAVLLYVQYRIARDMRLGFLALAYAWSAVTQLVYLLTFPGAFGPGQLLGASPTMAPWTYVISQAGFATLLIVQAVAWRAKWQVSRTRIRVWVATAALVLLVFVLAGTAGHATFPALTLGTQYQPLWYQVVAPLLCLWCVVGILIVAGRLETVTQVWLSVVLLTRAVAILSASEIASQRYSVGWYAARIEEVLGAIVVLAVFLVKINELILRLAARNRSTAEALAAGEARYASLANVVPQLIWTTNARGTFEYVNERWVEYTGRDLAASRGGWADLLHPHDGEAFARWQRSLGTASPFVAEFRLRNASGRYHWFLGNAVPVRDAQKSVAAWIGTCTDIDAQKRHEERDAFLARASERLGASLNVGATIEAIEELLVPRLAERLQVALIEEDGRYAVRGWPAAPALHDALAAALVGTEPVAVDETVRDGDVLLRSSGANSALIVPLVHAEAPIGALIVMRGGAHPYDRGDIALLRDFGRRAALALDHGRLYEREQRTADALQRAMLPAMLPQLPDIRFSASYSAASESQRVGGDFYDAFVLPDGRVALTIGDVTGHGLEAAVIMGEIRQALRAAAFESAEPSAILDRASRLLIASGRSVFVTAIFGILDPASGVFAYASAGHPAPLIDDGTTLRRLPTGGLPIGLRDDEGVDFGRSLQAPVTLVLFTDGLMEFARDLDEGERRIEAAIRALAREDIEHLATVLMKEVLGDDEPTDDIAILTLTIRRFTDPLAHELREWRFSSGDARTAALIRHEIGELLGERTGRPDVGFAGELVFGELIANAVRHAPGPVVVRATWDARGGAALTLDDAGAGFVPATACSKPYAESGRGLELVRAISDQLTITRSPLGGTRVTVSFHNAPVLTSSG